MGTFLIKCTYLQFYVSGITTLILNKFNNLSFSSDVEGLEWLSQGPRGLLAKFTTEKSAQN